MIRHGESGNDADQLRETTDDWYTYQAYPSQNKTGAMISKKILVQSATAGLMAGAALAMPLFFFRSSDVTFDESGGVPCAHASHQSARPCPWQRRSYDYPDAQHVLKAAPPLRRELSAEQRTLAERNRAAKLALTQLHRAYSKTRVERRASRTAQTVAAHTVATQVAEGVHLRSIRLQTNAMARCFDGKLNSAGRQQCAEITKLLRAHGPLIVQP